MNSGPRKFVPRPDDTFSAEWFGEFQAADRGDSITKVALVYYVRQAKGEPRRECREIVPITKVTDTQIVTPSRRFKRRNGHNVESFSSLRAIPCTPNLEQEAADYQRKQQADREAQKKGEERRKVEREDFYKRYQMRIRSAKTDNAAVEILKEAVAKAEVEGY